MAGFTESHVEEAALEWLSGLGYAVLPRDRTSHRMAPPPSAVSYDQVLLTERLIEALRTPQPPPARRDLGRGAAQGPADRDSLAHGREPPPAPLPDRRSVGRDRP